jgi:hypothetical protein
MGALRALTPLDEGVYNRRLHASEGHRVAEFEVPLGVEQNPQGVAFLGRQSSAPRRGARLSARQEVFEVSPERGVHMARGGRRGSGRSCRLGWLWWLQPQHQLFLSGDQSVQLRVGLIVCASLARVSFGLPREFGFEARQPRFERLRVPFRIRRARSFDGEFVGTDLARVERARGRCDQSEAAQSHAAQPYATNSMDETPVTHETQFTRNAVLRPWPFPAVPKRGCHWPVGVSFPRGL